MVRARSLLLGRQRTVALNTLDRAWHMPLRTEVRVLSGQTDKPGVRHAWSRGDQWFPSAGSSGAKGSRSTRGCVLLHWAPGEKGSVAVNRM